MVKALDIGRKVLKLIKDSTPTPEEIQKTFGISETEMNDVLEMIRSFNHPIAFSNGHYAISKTFKKEEKTIIINDGNLEPVELYISDIHSSDKGCNFRLLRNIVREAYHRGVRDVFIPGDLVAGRGVYPGQINDLVDLTFQQQIDRVEGLLPREKGLRYFVINGNHDDSWMKLDAGNVGAELSRRREDINYLGDGYGRVIKNGIKIDLVHLNGSGKNPEAKLRDWLGTYLRSHFKDKPDILLGGHFHEMSAFHAYETICLLPGHFQGPNEFVMRMGLMGKQGGYIVDYKIDRDRVSHFRAEGLYEPSERDAIVEVLEKEGQELGKEGSAPL
jgi:predicted phosphodiesterase